MYGNPGIRTLNTRFYEILDALKVEYENSISQLDSGMGKLQRDEMELKSISLNFKKN